MKFLLSFLFAMCVFLLIGCWLAEPESPSAVLAHRSPLTTQETESPQTAGTSVGALQTTFTSAASEPAATTVAVADVPPSASTVSAKTPSSSEFPFGALAGPTGAFPPSMDKDGLPFVPVNFEAQAFVAEIVSVPPGNWTNGNPPTLKIKVIDALGSQVRLGPATYQWSDHLMLFCGVGAEQEIAYWNSLPIMPPNPGSRWIVYGDMAYGGRWPDSEAMRTKVREALKRNARIAEKRKRDEEVAKGTAEARAHETRQSWDQGMTSDKLAEWARTADLVIVAKATLVSETPVFMVSKVLKGVYRKRNQNFISIRDIVKQIGSVENLWQANEEVILFLSEQLVIDHSVYSVEPVGAGVVLHNADRETLVIAECKKSAHKSPGTIVVCGHDYVNRAFASKFPVRPMIFASTYMFDPTWGEKYENVDWVIGLEIWRVDKPMVVYVHKPGEKEPRKKATFSGSLEEQIDQAHRFILSVISE